MLEGSPGAEHRRRGRSCAEPELPAGPGPGGTDAPADSWVGMWRAFVCIAAPALSEKFPRGRERGGIVPEIHAGKRRLDESAAARPRESRGCLLCLLSPHLDTC